MTETTRAFAWGHVNLNVGDLERSIAFYALFGFDVFLPSIPYLGLVREEVKPLSDESAEALGVPSGTRGRACILQLGDTFPKLDLTELAVSRARTPLETPDRGLVRICLASNDLQRDYDRLAGAGVSFLTPPRAAEGGLADIALCRDPDGSLIELIQIDAPKWIASAGG